jgi:hypothetical protein
MRVGLAAAEKAGKRKQRMSVLFHYSHIGWNLAGRLPGEGVTPGWSNLQGPSTERSVVGCCLGESTLPTPARCHNSQS